MRVKQIFGATPKKLEDNMNEFFRGVGMFEIKSVSVTKDENGFNAFVFFEPKQII